MIKPSAFFKAILTARAVGYSSLSRQSVSAGYYNILNFGDLLMPDILAYFGLRAIHCPRFKNAGVIGAGSILHMLPSDYQGCILGSGLIDQSAARTFSKAKTLLVRGYLTRDLCMLPESVRVGDPGLIADVVYKPYLAVDKPWRIGVIPHYRDLENRRLISLLNDAHDTVHLIDVRRTPREVIYDISKCHNIVSSSLHGLIVADSLGIPNHWMRVSDGLIGGNFKFDDYYSCFQMKRTPVYIKDINSFSKLVETASCPSIDSIESVKASIVDAFQLFCSSLQNS